MKLWPLGGTIEATLTPQFEGCVEAFATPDVSGACFDTDATADFGGSASGTTLGLAPVDFDFEAIWSGGIVGTSAAVSRRNYESEPPPTYVEGCHSIPCRKGVRLSADFSLDLNINHTSAELAAAGGDSITLAAQAVIGIRAFNEDGGEVDTIGDQSTLLVVNITSGGGSPTGSLSGSLSCEFPPGTFPDGEHIGVLISATASSWNLNGNQSAANLLQDGVLGLTFSNLVLEFFE